MISWRWFRSMRPLSKDKSCLSFNLLSNSSEYHSYLLNINIIIYLRHWSGYHAWEWYSRVFSFYLRFSSPSYDMTFRSFGLKEVLFFPEVRTQLWMKISTLPSFLFCGCNSWGKSSLSTIGASLNSKFLLNHSPHDSLGSGTGSLRTTFSFLRKLPI